LGGPHPLDAHIWPLPGGGGKLGNGTRAGARCLDLPRFCQFTNLGDNLTTAVKKNEKKPQRKEKNWGAENWGKWTKTPEAR